MKGKKMKKKKEHSVNYLLLSRYKNEQYLVYYRMRHFTSLRVFPHAGIHISMCISACGNTRKICVNPHSGFTHYRLHFRMWNFTYLSVLPLLKKTTKKNKKQFHSAEINIFVCISAWGNTHITV